MTIVKNILAALALSVLPLTAIAEDVAKPTGDVILTISGEIGVTNSNAGYQFDIDMLKALPAVEITTTTIWTDGEQVFVGVSLADLMEAVKANGLGMSATAINDYAVQIPMEDAVPGRAVVAYMRNGEAMKVRDKGPLWVVYPFDTAKEFQSEVIYSRSIWQLDRIAVE